MSKDPLPKQQWSKQIRNALKAFAKHATQNRGDIDRVAQALDLSRASVEKMKSSGTGSVESWIRLAIYQSNLSTDKVIHIFENIEALLRRLRPQDELDLMFEEARERFNKQELAAWMKLLISKHEVEKSLGLNIKANAAKKSPAKKKKLLKAAKPRMKKR